jgi:hypothetical protein
LNEMMNGSSENKMQESETQFGKKAAEEAQGVKGGEMLANGSANHGAPSTNGS